MKFRLFILLLLISSVLSAKPQKKYDAIFKKISKTYFMHKDGSIDYTYRKELKLNSQRSFDKMYGETFIVYNPTYQSLQINEAYTIRQDGSRVNTPKNAFNEVLPSSCTNCARYNNMKEMVVTHTALEYGATIVLEYTIRQKPGILMDLSEICVLAESSPIENYNVSITFPEDKIYHYKTPQKEPVISTKEGYKTLSWNYSSLRQTSAEPYLPPAIETYPHIRFTTANNEKLLKTILSQPSLTISDLPECDLVLSQITDIDNEYITNILAIRNWVADHVHYNPVPLKFNGHKIATANRTWESNCGNEPEKALLLATMLQRAGFDARIGVMSPNNLKDVSVAAISRWAVWTRDPKTNTPLILSPISKNQTSLTTLHPNEKLFLMNRGELEILSEQPTNQSTISGTVTLKEDGSAEGKLSAAFKHKTPSFNLLKEDKSSFFNNIIQNINVNSSNIEPSESHSGWQVEYNIQKYSKKELGNGYYMMKIPHDNLNETISANRLSARRQESLACQPVSLHYEFIINAPEGYRIVNLPANITEQHSFGNMKISLDTTSNNTITIHRQLLIKQDRISPSDYKAFRNMMVQWQDETYRRVIFKKSAK